MTRGVRTRNGVVVAACLLAGCAAHESPALPTSQDHADRAEAPVLSASNLDPASRDYLAGVRQVIAVKLFHPGCVGGWWRSWLWHCEYKTTRVLVQLTILRDGQLRSVTVREPSEYAAYNDAAVSAVRAAAPFPPIPDTVFPEKPVISVRLPIQYAVPNRR